MITKERLLEIHNKNKNEIEKFINFSKNRDFKLVSESCYNKFINNDNYYIVLFSRETIEYDNIDIKIYFYNEISNDFFVEIFKIFREQEEDQDE